MAELYDALQKSFMDPVMGMGIGLMAGQNMGQGLQQGLSNAQSLQAQQFQQQFRQNAAIEEMLNRAEYLRLANEEAAEKRAKAQAQTQQQMAIAQQYGLPLGVKPTAAQQNLVGAGNVAGTPGYEQALQDYVNKPGVSITNQIATEGERKSGSFLEQMNQAAAEEKRIEAAGNTEISIKDAAVAQYAPTWAQPLMLSKGGQERLNMMENWGRANLRDESGAVISAEEIQGQLPRYFPIEGDTEATKQQKARARRSAEEAQRIRAGRAAPSEAAQEPMEQAQDNGALNGLTPAEQSELLELLQMEAQ